MGNVTNMPALVPEFLVRDISASLNFYTNILGFNLEYERPENRFAMVSLQGSWIMLEQTEALGAVSHEEFVIHREWRTGELEYPFGRGINFQIVINDIKERYKAVAETRYPIKVPLEEKWYRVKDDLVGVKQFLLQDPDGYLLRIQQDLGVKPFTG